MELASFPKSVDLTPACEAEDLVVAGEDQGMCSREEDSRVTQASSHNKTVTMIFMSFQ